MPSPTVLDNAPEDSRTPIVTALDDLILANVSACADAITPKPNKVATKYLGNKNEDYPRKNWSSLILWNCDHPKNKGLTPEFIQNQTGSYLHRFSWLCDDEIGELSQEWNWLAIEYEENPEAKLIHYTLGTPCFKEYQLSSMSSEWYKTYKNLLEGMDK